MKIISLNILSSWKNLNGFSIKFDSSRDVTVLLGKNGSAKSNLLEVIIKIFRDIDLKLQTPFDYKLIYEIAGKDIEIIHQNSQYKIKLDSTAISLSQLRDNHLPKYIVGYYSGTSDRFEELFKEHDKAALKNTLHEISPGEKLVFRNFINARPIHGLYALLAFYVSTDTEILSFLEKFPRIESFDSALIVLQQPDWAPKNSSAEDFWGAKGPVGELLQIIKKFSLAPFSRKVTIKKDFRRREYREQIYLFIPNIESLSALALHYNNDAKAFFQALDTMRLSDLIADFKVRVKVKGVKNSIHTRQLSEGEQQLLTVLGLMRFTQNSESLYILDEPDTHLNPAWGLDYLSNLRDIGGINKSSHTILATHDPLLVSGLLKNEIRVLIRTDKGTVSATEPEESPRGIGVAGVLTSELYGLESQLDNFSLKVLKRIYEVSAIENYSQKSKHLRRLKMIIPSLNSIETSPDPYRNIAKLAYEQALNIIINSNHETDTKLKLVDAVSKLLYNEANKL